MNWLLLLFISIFSYSIGVLLQRVLLKEETSDAVVYSVVSNLIAGVLIIIFSLTQHVSFAGLLTVIPNILLMIVFYAITNFTMFKALKLIEASEFTILFATRALWSIVAAVVFLRESFSLQQVAGALLIFVSVILTSRNPKKISLGKGQVLTLACALFFGTEFANDAVILQQVDAFVYTPLIFLLPNMLLWAIHPQKTRNMLILATGKLIPKIALLGVFFAVSATTYFLSYQVGRNAAQIASINQTSVIIIVLLAVIFLHERINLMRKLLASVISFVGILLLA